MHSGCYFQFSNFASTLLVPPSTISSLSKPQEASSLEIMVLVSHSKVRKDGGDVGQMYDLALSTCKVEPPYSVLFVGQARERKVFLLISISHKNILRLTSFSLKVQKKVKNRKENTIRYFGDWVGSLQIAGQNEVRHFGKKEGNLESMRLLRVRRQEARERD